MRQVCWFFVGVASGIRACSSKEKVPKGPFFISGCNPGRLPIHPRTNSRHSAKPHTWLRQAGDAISLPAALQTTGVSGIRLSLLPDPLSVLFPIKHIQPPASDQIQAIAEKTFKPGLGSPISQCHRKLFGWYNNHLLFSVFQKFNPSYRQAL